MRSIRTTVGVGLALAALSGCMSGYYSPPIQSNPVTGARWQDPAHFKSQAVARADWIERQVREDIDAGRVSPAASDELDAQRRVLNAELDGAMADGRIDARERDRVQRRLDVMGNTGRRYGGPRAYGGGPRVIDQAGQHLYQQNWRRLY